MTDTTMIWLGAVSRIRPPAPRRRWPNVLREVSRYVLIVMASLATGVMLAWLLELQSKGMS